MKDGNICSSDSEKKDKQKERKTERRKYFLFNPKNEVKKDVLVQVKKRVEI